MKILSVLCAAALTLVGFSKSALACECGHQECAKKEDKAQAKEMNKTPAKEKASDKK